MSPCKHRLWKCQFPKIVRPCSLPRAPPYPATRTSSGGFERRLLPFRGVRAVSWIHGAFFRVGADTAVGADGQTGATMTEVANAANYARLAFADWQAAAVSGIKSHKLRIVTSLRDGVRTGQG